MIPVQSDQSVLWARTGGAQKKGEAQSSFLTIETSIYCDGAYTFFSKNHVDWKYKEPGFTIDRPKKTIPSAESKGNQ